MKNTLRLTLVIALLVCTSQLAVAQKKPNLSGVWRRTQGQELLTIEHREPQLHLVYWIKDISGERTLDLTAMTDGKEYKQTVLGQPATVVLRWDGTGLTWEFWRESGSVKIHNRRTFKLSDDGHTITAERVDFNLSGTPRPSFTETWTKTTPPAPKSAADIKAEQEVTKLHQDWLAALMRGDAEAVRRFLADDYVEINDAGSLRDKAQVIAGLKPPPATAPKVDAKPFGEGKIRFYGNTAITTGGLSFSSTAGSQNLRYSTVAVKRQGQWQVVSAQVTIAKQ